MKTPNTFQRNYWNRNGFNNNSNGFENNSAIYKTSQSNSKNVFNFRFEGNAAMVDESDDTFPASCSEKTTKHKSTFINEA